MLGTRLLRKLALIGCVGVQILLEAKKTADYPTLDERLAAYRKGWKPAALTPEQSKQRERSLRRPAGAGRLGYGGHDSDDDDDYSSDDEQE